MTIPKAELIFPFNADFPTVHCPVCGSVVQKSDSPTDLPTCEHLEFAYLDVMGDFLYLHPKFEPLLKQMEEDCEKEGCDLDPYEVLEALENKLDGGTRLMLSFETSGMACGPTSSTVIYSFNFLTKAD